MDNPKISVVLPAFNAQKYIGQSIDSILGQTYRNIELIIINDGSTDRTAEIIRAKADARIVYYENRINQGLIKSLNKGFFFAKGEFIARMDADDVSLPDRLELQLDYLSANSDISILGTNVIYKSTNTPAKVLSNWTEHAVYLLKYNTVFHPTVMLRKKALRKMNLFYDRSCSFGEDYKLWADASTCGLKISSMDLPLLIYNDLNPDQISSANGRTQKEIAERIKLSYAIHYFDSLIIGNIALYRKLINHIAPDTKAQAEECIGLGIRLIEENRKFSHFDHRAFEEMMESTIGLFRSA